ncbi:pol polyprotein [Nephila pilipes]|uniref:Pol polyprotein n=1 Tax=Nephila pilipes TaxID=299642 RepID=A0A8X6UGL4_NEPPI|nr:pol polyprotein [Nephila pilipes]
MYPMQYSKVHRHTLVSLEKFSDTSTRFDLVCFDIIGSLSLSKGFHHCLTSIDHFIRWVEVIPLPNIQATTLAEAFHSIWIDCFGVPSTITIDQGRQFESCIFRNLSGQLGVQRIRTTEYHPQSNALIEKFHQLLKASVMCHATEKWMEAIPTIFLGLRASLTENIGSTSAEMMYEKTLRLSGEVFDNTDKLFKVNINERSSTISIDLGKPVFLPNTDSDITPSATKVSLNTPAKKNLLETRSSRHVHFPDYFVSSR